MRVFIYSMRLFIYREYTTYNNLCITYREYVGRGWQGDHGSRGWVEVAGETERAGLVEDRGSSGHEVALRHGEV